ncbi:MAG: glycosyltransferase family 4 protein [Bacteroidota bacterium]
MRPRVLFVSLATTSFVRDDLALLRERYGVTAFTFGTTDSARGLLAGWRRQRAWLKREGDRADLVVGWFADFHLALPALWASRRGVPLAVMLGGFDAACLPGLGYGVFCSRWRAPLARTVLRRASRLLPVAEALLESTNAWASEEGSRQGVRVHVPRLATPARVLPTGYDADAWPMGRADRGATVCAVAHLADWPTFYIKGGDLLLEVARQMPEARFEIVGVAPRFGDALLNHEHVPGNVRLVPPVERETLAEVYARSSVVAQLSRTEGLPDVLCEAMLCGCVPAVSAVGAMEEVAGGLGAVAETPEEATEAVRLALAVAPEQRHAARERIATHYSRERRRRDLFAHLDALIEAQ